MTDWDDSDNAPQREMMERSCARAGWLIATGGPNDTDAGEPCLWFPLPNRAALAVDSLRPPLYGETIAVGQWRAIPVYDADREWFFTDHEWMGEDDDAPEGSHAWTLTWNPGIVGVTGYRLEPSVTPAPIAVLFLLNALNAEIHS